MMVSDRFAGRDLWIVTQHKKESVIAPILSRSLSVYCHVFNQIDTDQFGTFCGTVRRVSALEAARAKCAAVASIYPGDLILASEGSFGPHPAWPFAPCNEELLLLKDLKSNRDYKVSYLTFRTNMAASEIQNEEELKNFALTAGFPSHGLILRTNDYAFLKKGITSWTLLLHTFRQLKDSCQKVFAETDMRAMFNPTRMMVIGKAARLLTRLLHSRCPRCGSPGFGIVRTVTGLPCRACGMPTESPSHYVRLCEECLTELPCPSHKKEEDPMYCHFCNP
jgi:ribosomal protein L37E